MTGIPDCWYSGSSGDLWIEYKYLKTAPKKCTPGLSENQKKWLRERYHEGRNVAVVVGTLNGAVLFRDLTWETQQPINNTMTTRELAAWILSQTGENTNGAGPDVCLYAVP